MSKHLFILLLVLLVACQSEYDRLVKSEMASGKRYENLLFDFTFNQTRQKFYDQCWEMNKSKVVSQGPKNEYAMHILEPGVVEGEDDKIEMLFYGIFDEEKIMHGMDIRYSYPKWSVWSEEYHADKLVPKLINLFENKFPGNDFIAIPLKSIDQKTYVKVDRNRQVVIYAKDTKDVVVKIEDLGYKLGKTSM